MAPMILTLCMDDTMFMPDPVLEAMRQALAEEYLMRDKHKDNAEMRALCRGRIEGIEIAIRIYQRHSSNNEHYRPRFMPR